MTFEEGEKYRNQQKKVGRPWIEQYSDLKIRITAEK